METRWSEMAERFADVQSLRELMVASRAAGLDLKDMLDSGIIDDDDLLRDALRSGDDGDATVSDFALKAAWLYFAHQHDRQAAVIDMAPLGDGVLYGVSDFERDWRIIAANYRAVCSRLARRGVVPAVSDPVQFATSAELATWFENHHGESISKRRLQQLLIENLGDGDKRQVKNDGRGTWVFRITAAEEYFAKTSWKKVEK